MSFFTMLGVDLNFRAINKPATRGADNALEDEHPLSTRNVEQEKHMTANNELEKHLYKIDISILEGNPQYADALHDVERLGAYLDYWGRGYASLTDEDIQSLAKYHDYGGVGIVGLRIPYPPTMGRLMISNGISVMFYQC